MRHLVLSRCRMTLVLLIVFSCHGIIFAQKPIKCSNKMRAPRYEMGWKTYSAKGSKILFLAISVDARNFSRDNMIALARRLSQDFCHEQKLNVEIFDKRNAARDFFPTSEIEWFHKHWRGTYVLDRDVGTESISFSTSADKPKDEVKIDLAARSRT